MSTLKWFSLNVPADVSRTVPKFLTYSGNLNVRGDLTITGDLYQNGLKTSLEGKDSLPIGSIIQYPDSITEVPTGYLRANGEFVLKTDYVELYNLFGSTFGIENATEFRLPTIPGHIIKAEFINDRLAEGLNWTNIIGSGIFYVSPNGVTTVGIGTTNPNPLHALDVNGDINFTGRLLKNGVEFVGAGGAGGSGWSAEAGKIFTLTSKVGIGIEFPKNILHIRDISTVIDLEAGMRIGGSTSSFTTINQVNRNLGTDFLYIQGSRVVNSINVPGNNIILNPLGGNVGIRTTEVGFALDVGGDINLSGDLRINGQIVLSASEQLKPTWSSLGSDLFYISGNVGIGTFAGNNRLTVDGNINLNSNINTFRIAGNEILSRTTLGTTVVNSSLTRVGTLTSLNVSGNLGIGTTQPAFKVDILGDINIRGNILKDGFPFTGSGSWTETGGQAVFTNARVGINTSFPESNLHVFGSVGTFTRDSGVRIGTNNSYGMINMISGSEPQLLIQGATPSNTDVDITLNPLGGKVGIGITSPQSLLHVGGPVRIDVEPGYIWRTLPVNDLTTDVQFVRYYNEYLIGTQDGKLFSSPDGSGFIMTDLPADFTPNDIIRYESFYFVCGNSPADGPKLFYSTDKETWEPMLEITNELRSFAEFQNKVYVVGSGDYVAYYPFSEPVPVDERTWDVSNNNDTSYTFSNYSSGENISIEVEQGTILIFNIDSIGQPFWIKEVPETGIDFAVTTGIDDNGIEQGTITWDTTNVLPGTYYYISENVEEMTGEIVITGPPRETRTWDVSNNDNTSYTFSNYSSGDNISIEVEQGTVLVFNINSTGQPFWIKEEPVTGTESAVTTGLDDNGIEQGTITWDTTDVTPGTYYYISENEAGMTGEIVITERTPIPESWEPIVVQGDWTYVFSTFQDIYIVGDQVFAQSTDGENWDVQTTGLTTKLLSLASNGSQTVLVGEIGSIYTYDFDQETWALRDSDVTSDLLYVVWNSKLETFVIFTSDSKLLTSKDGLSWEFAVTIEPITSVTSALWINDESQYIVGGPDGQVAISDNTQPMFETRSTCIVTSGKLGVNNSEPMEVLDVGGNVNVSEDSVYKIDGQEVLALTTLGSTVVNSSLTSVGTLSSLTVSGNTIIQGDLTVNGTQTIVNTEVESTSRLEVTNNGTGPAAIINQTGDQPILDIQDDGTSVLFIADGGNVGIGSTQPSQKLDVVGNASISGDLAVDTDVLVVNSTDNRVGINTDAPTVDLDVLGKAKITSSDGYALEVVGSINFTGGLFQNDVLFVSGDGGGEGGGPSDALPVGAFVSYPWSAPIPSGFLKCNGEAVSRFVYAQLFTIFGEDYGPGNGSTTFNLPLFFDNIVKFRALGSTTTVDYLPIGSIITLSHTIDPYPDGWLKCDGSSISRTLYSQLFAVIGTTYGPGDGVDTFDLPNLVDQGIKFRTTIEGGLADSSYWIPTPDSSLYNMTNVGIGTTEPQERLHVEGNILLAGNLIPAADEQYDLGTSTAKFRSLYLKGTTIFLGNTKITTDENTGEIAFRDNETDELRNLVSENTQNIATVDGNTIFEEGNVGIGITDPVAKLHVSGNTVIDGNLTVNGTQTIVNTEVETTSRLEITNTGTGPAVLVNQTGAQPIADFQDDGTSVLFIADGGNVGIGSTQPSQKLDVVGNASISGDLAVDTDVLVVNSTDNRVGINTDAPTEALDVVGKAKITSLDGYALEVVGDINFTGGLFQNGVPFVSGNGNGGGEGAGPSDALPVGAFVSYPWSAPIPDGFLKCNGEEVSRSVYAQLFAIFGEEYGSGNGSSTFNLPLFFDNIVKFRALGGTTTVDYLPIGSVITLSWAIDPYPDGWLKCDGFEVSRELYSQLFAAVGTDYGSGDGSTTFNLPTFFNQGIKFRTTIEGGLVDSSYWIPAPDSSLYNMTNVGIGTTQPQEKLHVEGNILMAGNLIPAANEQYDLGTPTSSFRDIYLSGTTIFLGNTKISTDVNTGEITFRDKETDTLQSIVTENTQNIVSVDGNTIFESGNVGIGITAPQFKLHVSGNTRIDGDLTVNGTQTIVNTEVETTSRLEITNTGTGPAVLVNQTGAQPIADFQDDGVSSLFIADGGNVGIGTTAPAARLHTFGTALANQIRIEGPNTNNSAFGINHNADGSNDFGLVIRRYTETTNNFLYIIGHPTLGPHRWYNLESVEQMRMLNNGNIGIGTTNPIDRCEVFGGRLRINSLNPDGGDEVFDVNTYNLYLHGNGGSGAVQGKALVNFHHFSKASISGLDTQIPFEDATPTGQFGLVEVGIGSPSSRWVGDFVFRTKAISAKNEPLVDRMRILHNGNVGIGITTPTEKLHVNGNASITGNMNGVRLSSTASRIVTGAANFSGWFRIAESAPGRVCALFIVRDRRSGRHGCVRFSVNQAFGSPATVNIENVSGFSVTNFGGTIERIRTIAGGTSVGHAVEVFIRSNDVIAEMDVTMHQNDLDPGYTIVNFQPGEVPSGSTAHEIDLQTSKVVSGVFRNSTPLLTTHNEGNVGIGVTNPGSLLHVEGDARISTTSLSTSFDKATSGTLNIQGPVLNTGDTTSYTNLGQAITFRSNTVPRYPGSLIETVTAIRSAYDTSGVDTISGGHALQFWTFSGWGSTGGGSLTEKMRITSSGNVGIGTTNPQTQLHILGQSSSNPAILRIDQPTFGFSTLTNANPGLELIARSMNTTSQYTPAIKFMSSDTDFTTQNPRFLASIVGRATEAYNNDSTTGRMSIDFLTTDTNPGANSFPQTRMTITGAGNVGIGTTSPGSLLHVNGNLQVGTAVLTQPTGSTPLFMARAWVNFNGTTSPPSIRASGNVSSVSRTSTARYVVNFATSMPSVNYSVITNSSEPTASSGVTNTAVTRDTVTTSSVGVRTSAASDAPDMYVAVFI